MNARVRFINSPWLGVLIAGVVFFLGYSIRQAGFSRSWNSHPAQEEIYGKGFVDETNILGIHFYHKTPSHFDPILIDKERLVYFGTGVGIADVNGDGWMDVFLLAGDQRGQNHLYINQGGKSFSEEAKKWNIASTNVAGANVSPVFFDYDNDGKPDLLIARMGCVFVFHNTGDHFEDKTRESGLNDCKNSLAAVPMDIDNDGYLDVFLLRYWGNHNYFDLAGDYFVFPSGGVDSKHAGSNTLYHNERNGKFKEVPIGPENSSGRWSFDATLGDLTGTGESLMYIANDFGPDELKKIGNGTLINLTEKMGILDRRNGMSTGLLDLDGSGIPFIWVSNIWRDDYQQEGNFLLKLDTDYKRTDYARKLKVQNCGWAWGAAFSDFNLDGRVDFYVANGFITNPKSKDQIGKFVRKDSYDYSTATRMTSLASNADARLWPPLRDLSFEGNQIDCLFLNDGDYFENAAAWATPNREWDGRAVALIDFDNNGMQDLIVTTQDGPAHFLKNSFSPSNRWAGFRLIGTKSNRDAVGARLKLTQEKWTSYRWALGGKSGFMAFSDPRTHFGLKSDTPFELEIRWPSGQVQSFKNLLPGHYYEITEGKSTPTSL